MAIEPGAKIRKLQIFTGDAPSSEDLISVIVLQGTEVLGPRGEWLLVTEPIAMKVPEEFVEEMTMDELLEE